MDISVNEAKGKLTELVKSAEAREEVILTRHGKPIARITAVKPQFSGAESQILLNSVRGRWQNTDTISAEHITDGHYAEHGLSR